MREARVAGLYDGDLETVERVKRATRMVPVTDGHALRDVLQEWSIRLRPGRDARLLHERAGRGPRWHEPCPHDPDPAGVHAELRVRRPAAAPRRPEPDGRQPPAGPGSQCRHVARAPAAGGRPFQDQGSRAWREQLAGPPRPEGRPRHRGDLRGALRLRDGRPARQVDRDLVDLRRPPGRDRRPRRGHGPRLDAAAVRFHDHRRRARGDDARRLVEPDGTADQRRPAGHDRVGRAPAAAALPARLPAPQPLRLRHPPAVPALPDQRRAAEHHREGVALVRHGRHREGDGLRTADEVRPGHRRGLPHRRRG